jgi:hypothetical protein
MPHPVLVFHVLKSLIIVRPIIYEQSQQKLGTFLENKIITKLKISKSFFDKSWSTKGQ